MPGLIASFVFAAAIRGVEPAPVPVTTGEVRTVTARYVMNRRFVDLDAEMTIVGSMALEKGRRLKWSTEKPVVSATVISSEGIRMWDAMTGGRIERKASDMPWLKTIFACQNALLGGDFDNVDGFSVERLENGDVAATPVKPELSAVFSRMEVRFSKDGRLAERVTMTESGGDKMTIEFDDVKINEVIPEGEWKAR